MTDADAFTIAGLIHHEWSDAAVNLANVNAETDDGSKDWAEFHELRLERAQQEFDRFSGLRTRFTNEYREVINKVAYG